MIGSTYRRTGTKTLRVVPAFLVAALVSSGVAYAKPKPPPVASLNEAVCNSISGVWALGRCTIPAGSRGAVVPPGFKIVGGITLDVQGKLTIPDGVTVANAGTINVTNAGGVLPDDSYGEAPG